MQPPAPDFRAEIASRIAAREPCWFPGLADLLVAGFWADTRSHSPGQYSTAAWTGAASPAILVPVPGQPLMVVEPQPAGLGAEFEAPDDPKVAPEVLRAIAGALRRLAAGGAGDAVAGLVRSVHCIAAHGAGYDSSHSDPAIPFSVFVSVPLGERHAELRVAESLLHEAMHLQLTLIERHVPLVARYAGTGYSPWQQCRRPVQGLLHGLYVFAAVHQWLARLTADPMLSADDAIYVERRLCEIKKEVREVSTLGSAPGLTSFGRRLAAWLLCRVGRTPTSLPIIGVATG